ncbi:uncharacterized protein si:ch211-149e23.4 [Engraulis encrasicolus]|uniref:uncharacterized protein si:ch211-149e23.4 n=1 Tax=Engraulis encrasicolus TaxID=184585 RepID=UPI002FD5B96A
MGPLALMAAGFLLSQALSSDMHDVEERNVTATLGEDVYLPCLYTGNPNDTVFTGTWRRSGSQKKLVVHYGMKVRATHGFSLPASIHNLTVRMQVRTVEAEGSYTCEFNTLDGFVMHQVSLTVLVQPEVTIQVMEEIENNTHYQTVSCLAANTKPAPEISWEVNGGAPSEAVFAAQTQSTRHGNGTLDLTSTLRFPTRLNDESAVVCVVEHPTLAEPRRTTALVQTFVAPDVTMETGLMVVPAAVGPGEYGGRGGRRGEMRAMRVVNCTATGGRPQAQIAWILPEGENTLPSETMTTSDDDDDDDDDGTLVSSVMIPEGQHEGGNVTCVVSHPKLTNSATRTFTLPTYYLSSVRLFSVSVNASTREDVAVDIEDSAVESVFVEEGEAGMAFSMEVQGTAPTYRTECTKDGSSLPDGVELVNGVLSFRGPAAVRYTGLYECNASFYKHITSAHLNVTVNPGIRTPVAPSVAVKTWTELDSVIIKCVATDAVPAPNISWSLPPGLTGEMVQKTSLSPNGSVCASSTLSLPTCLSEEHTVSCLVGHQLFEDPERREIVLPACARPNITVQSSTVWHGGLALAKLECRVESVRPRAAISWHMEEKGKDHTDAGGGAVEELQGVEEDLAEGGGEQGVEVLMEVVQLPLVEYQGKSVVCAVRHPSLLEPERRAVQLQATAPPEIHVLLKESHNSSVLRAVCEYSSEAENASLAWLLPGNRTAAAVGVASTSYAMEGSKVTTSAVYEFTLAAHEGSDLTCLIRPTRGPEQRRVVPVPQYYISSMKVMNDTTCERREGIAVCRLALQEHLTYQTILLQVSGNVPGSQITCSRTDGSAVPVVREISPLTGALVFPGAVTSSMAAGQYLCRASFHHHTASVYIQVEVASEEAQHLAFVSICFSSAVAISVLLVIALCVFCKRHSSEKKRRKKRESIATLTSLMHDPRSPELKKAALPGVKSQQYAELVSIVLIEKTNV